MFWANWRKLAGLTWPQRRLVAESVLWLLVARLALRLVPFRWIAPRLGRERAESAPGLPVDQLQRARQIGWAVETASRHTFWDSRCLAQAIAARMMLEPRRIPHTLYLGVGKDGRQDLIAHAWVRCGPAIVTGRVGYRRFTVVSSFAG